MPRSFMADFVDPAFELWKQNQSTPHLAVHAVAQLDILAEIVARTLGRKVSDFKTDLCVRRPVMRIIWDMHDNHKHHGLTRHLQERVATQGQRPEPAKSYGFFVGHSFSDGPLTRFSYMAFVTDDGTKHKVFDVLIRARREWDEELEALGL